MLHDVGARPDEAAAGGGRNGVSMLATVAGRWLTIGSSGVRPGCLRGRVVFVTTVS